jgi:hypothetical protein
VSRVSRAAIRSPLPSALAVRSAAVFYAVVVVIVVLAVIATVAVMATKPRPTATATGKSPRISSAILAGTRVCGKPILHSPYRYDGPAGSYSSGTAGLPTYGKPDSDFPKANAGVILATGKRDYASYQLNPNTVYYLLPGTHIGSFQADTNDAFVGGYSNGISTVLTSNYSQNSAIGSNFSDGNQSGVTVEYLTIKKYQPDGNSAAVNADSNTGWTIRYNTITLNVPGAGVILGADNVLKDNCMTQNGQYGFQSVATGSWGQDSLTGGPYNLIIEGNEISYNDTCDYEGLLDNPVIGWKNHNPVPPQYRNAHCGSVSSGGGQQGGFKLWQTNGVTIKGNYIHNNWGPGGWADTGNANTTFTGNTITYNTDAAIFEEISYNFSITNNYIARNALVGGVGGPGFPSAAIYISESGSDTQFGGVPACAEVSCSGQRSYRTESVISNNTLIDNGGTVLLWQNSNRHCSDSTDSICTLVKGGASGPFTISRCKLNLKSASTNTTTYVGNQTGSPQEDWWDGCMWKTENVSITHNIFNFNPANIMGCNQTAWSHCGAGGIFSEYSSPPTPQPSWVVPTQITFFQHNVWSDNIYNGPSTFYAWNQGNGANPVSWANWTGKVSDGDRCSSANERQSGYCTGPFGQDAGSMYNPKPDVRT